MKVLIIGGVSYDQIIQIGEIPTTPQEALFARNSYTMIGGTGSGKALNLSRLGFETSFQFRIGDDEEGKKIKDFYAAQPLQTLIEIDPKHTECHTNLMDDHGKRTSIYTHYLEFEPEMDQKPTLDLATKCDLYVVNIINYCRQFLPDLINSKKPIWIDIHDYDGKNDYHADFISEADYLFMSGEAMTDPEDFMRQQILEGKKLVVCTFGKNGALCIDEHQNWYRQSIIDGFDTVDTNGAGDAFMAGFMYEFYQGTGIEKALKTAAYVAGLTVTSEKLYHEDLSVEFLTSRTY